MITFLKNTEMKEKCETNSNSQHTVYQNLLNSQFDKFRWNNFWWTCIASHTYMYKLLNFDSKTPIREGGLTRLIYFLIPVYFKEVATIFKQWKNARKSVYHFMAIVTWQENPKGLTDLFGPFWWHSTIIKNEFIMFHLIFKL